MKSLTDQLTCAKRELALRRNVYRQRVERHLMLQATADHEIECMAAIVASIEKLNDLAETSEEMKREYRREHPRPVPSRPVPSLHAEQ